MNENERLPTLNFPADTMDPKDYMVNPVMARLEDIGKIRAELSCLIFEHTGNTPPDNFIHGDMTIWNPWWSDCGRFERDPYITYGRQFIDWLTRPLEESWDKNRGS